MRESVKKLLYGLDWHIFLATFFIMSFGLVTLASVAPELFSQQLFYVILGLVLFLAIGAVDYRLVKSIEWPIYFFSLFLLASPFIFGSATRGSIRWIEIGEFRIQPSEIIKPFLILFLASQTQSLKFSKIKNIIKLFFLFLILALLVFKQPDLGSTIVYAATFSAIITVGGLHPLLISFGILTLLVVIPLTWVVLKPYQKTRILSFINPGLDPLGAGYNAIQATIAVGSGQLFGRGFGRGTQSHLLFLPEHHTDFIFASLAEEFGLFGSSLLIILYLLLLWRILRIGQNAPDKLGSLIAIGGFSIIFSQVFINIGMNIGLLPITGITLPLVSYGGSSIISTMLILGMIQSVAKETKRI